MWAQTFQSYDNIYTPVKLYWKTGKTPCPTSAVAATLTLSLELLLSHKLQYLCASAEKQLRA